MSQLTNDPSTSHSLSSFFSSISFSIPPSYPSSPSFSSPSPPLLSLSAPSSSTTTSSSSSTSSSSPPFSSEQILRLKGHSRSVRGVSFSPKERDLFCSGGYDGLLNFYRATSAEMVSSISLASPPASLNGVRFLPDGRNVAATSNSKRLYLVDVHTGKEALSYENTSFSGRDRTALHTVESGNGHQGHVISTTVDGRGLVYYDIRVKNPVKQIPNLHDQPIRDIISLKPSWVSYPQNSSFPLLQTASEDGKSKVIDFDRSVVDVVDLQGPLYSLAHSPESLNSTTGFQTCTAFGGNCSMFIQGPERTIRAVFRESQIGQVWKLRFTSIGTELFLACDDGALRRYRRSRENITYSDVIFKHSHDIEDLDISVDDEYLITASQDSTVGLVRIRKPTFGASGFGALI